MRHTEGPWSYDRKDGTIVTPLKGHEYFTQQIIATIHPDSVDDPDERAGNGLLIAAAPELLAALVQVVEWLDRTGESRSAGGKEYSYVTEARAAIASAKGEVEESDMEQARRLR